MNIYNSVLLVLFFSLPSQAIVNIESMRMQNSEVGLKFVTQASAEREEGNSNEKSYKVSGQMHWQGESTEHLSLLSYKFEESQGTKTEDQSLFHYRWAYKLSKSYSYEIFTQWEQDYFKRLLSRGLLGMGVRQSLFQAESLKANLGVGAFYSREEYKPLLSTQQNEVEELSRINIYFSLLWNIWENINFESVVYYQPKVDLLKDYRLHWQNQFDFSVNKYLSWLITYQYAHDNLPPEAVKKSDHEYGSAIKFKF